jgi:hypothetical protein
MSERRIIVDHVYVNDLHGNNVEAVWHAPEAVRGAPIHRGLP